MHRFWQLIIRRLLEAVQARCVVEVGVATGALTAELLEYCEATGAVLHAIDPQPQIDVDEWSQRYGDRLVFHRALSLTVLAGIHGADAVLIDGDHNWYTVYHELETLEKSAVGAGEVPPLVLLHDVGWPYGRRDMYYDPDTVPAAHRQPHRRVGLVPGQSEPTDGAINCDLHNALNEGTEHNGVRTAVEDFVEQSQLGWEVSYLPGFHGLGIAVTSERLGANPELRSAIGYTRSDEFLQSLARDLELARVTAEVEANRRLSEAQERLERELKLDLERLADMGRLQELLVDAERRLAVVPQLQLRLAELERDLAATRNEAASAREEARTLDQRAMRSEHVLAEVMSSPSWRMTQPLRTAKRSVSLLRGGRRP